MTILPRSTTSWRYIEL